MSKKTPKAEAAPLRDAPIPVFAGDVLTMVRACAGEAILEMRDVGLIETLKRYLATRNGHQDPYRTGDTSLIYLTPAQWRYYVGLQRVCGLVGDQWLEPPSIDPLRDRRGRSLTDPDDDDDDAIEPETNQYGQPVDDLDAPVLPSVVLTT